MNIPDNYRAIDLVFITIIFIPKLFRDIFYQENVENESIFWRIYVVASYLCSMLYIPVWLVYSLTCQTSLG